MLSTDQKGAAAELAIAAKAARLGIGVSRPMVEGLRYDLIFDWHRGLQRVQCKWATRDGEVILVRAYSCRRTPTGLDRRGYSAADVDLIAVYCAELDEAWVLPITQFGGKERFYLRLTPTRNNQRSGVTLAEPYRLGAIAQLEERLRGTQEAGGSSPPGSTGDEALKAARVSSVSPPRPG